MPGAPLLAVELGVDPKTIDSALRLLEVGGLLLPQGAGKRRRILLPEGSGSVRPLRVSILLSEVAERRVDYLLELQHSLVDAGHEAHFSRKHLVELGMSVSRVRKLVEESQADAWVVVAGSREVLKWFCSQSLPVFALFGRHDGLPIAAAMPNRGPAYVAAARSLVGLGHRRISLLARRLRRLPDPGDVERAFLEELELQGIQTGNFNLPDWDDTVDGFEQLLNNLFRVTPPTALIAQEAFLFNAAHHFLARRGLRIPQDVSLLCADSEPSLGWCIPQISHFRWQSRPLVQRIVRWVANVSRGKTDLRQSLTPAEFIEGGTIGPVNER